MSIAFERDVLYTFMTHAGIVVVKTISMSALTSYMRMKKKVFANEEDASKFGGNQARVTFGDADVERVRRCHQNDIENVGPFVMLGLLYCLTDPDPVIAAWHFRIFTVSRLLHTIAYLGKKQPARGVAMYAGWAVCASLAFSVIRHALKMKYF